MKRVRIEQLTLTLTEKEATLGQMRHVQEECAYNQSFSRCVWRLISISRGAILKSQLDEKVSFIATLGSVQKECVHLSNRIINMLNHQGKNVWETRTDHGIGPQTGKRCWRIAGEMQIPGSAHNEPQAIVPFKGTFDCSVKN
jgi:hypothetical protein